MKRLFVALILTALGGCSDIQLAEQTPPAQSAAVTDCVGSDSLPAGLKTKFQTVDDPALLNQALGEPDKGGLCQGQVYESKTQTSVTLYRAWNSTNPNSQFGHWWAFSKPSGQVTTYRADYAICYQWSPLDKLVTCTLKPGTRVVVGTGQSAQCSQYLTYPVSAAQQIYIDNAQNALADCRNYSAEFSWK